MVNRYIGDKFVGLSSETKPTNVDDGAIFIETDTLDTYILSGGSWQHSAVSLEGNINMDNNQLLNIKATKFYQEIDKGTVDDDTVTINWEEGNYQKLKAKNVVSIYMSNPTLGRQQLLMEVDTTEEPVLLFPGSNVKGTGEFYDFEGSVAFKANNLTGTSFNIINVYYDGVNYYLSAARDFQ